MQCNRAAIIFSKLDDADFFDLRNSPASRNQQLAFPHRRSRVASQSGKAPPELLSVAGRRADGIPP